MPKGDARKELRELMNLSSTALLETAEDIREIEVENAYQLLIVTIGVPTEIKSAAKQGL
ncbi:hypothetical protein JSQ81_15545 [Sporosarcina sp. Marseille-Q4063]|uniref:hypothetical protein n=1 Tax=Sporosarcina sp. Marseille-Q4063 TaxID=2810514 RepID=UPI001BB0ACFD|nr:hypothetical protein [Sporosarcina sp. Marseille-Q4063]QUW21209.1 hypothetical protein JSQ81_15545 [Sporosarcina sp. Marseille-Q4063]